MTRRPSHFTDAQTLTDSLTAMQLAISELSAAMDADGLSHIRWTGQQLQRLLETIAKMAEDTAAIVEAYPDHWEVPPLSQKGTLQQWVEMIDFD